MPTPPRHRRHELTRQKILDSARHLLLTQGVQAISMRTLAEQVDYSPAALYKYFANKEEILAALRQEAWELLAAHDAGLSAGMPMAEMFVQLGRGYIDFATRYPQYYKLMMMTAEGGPASLEEFKRSPNFRELLQFIESAEAQGVFRIPEGYAPFHLALLSWFIVHAVSLLKLTMMSQCADEFESASIEVMKLVKEMFSHP